jgi:hypothetical protein
MELKRDEDKDGKKAGPEAGKPGSKKPNWFKRFGKHMGAAVGGGLIVGALLFRSCYPATEGPCDAECPSPSSGDLRCEGALGEADPFDDNFDRQACGFCGDGIRQRLAETGSEPTEENGVMVQDVTDPNRAETEENCPVDFHCGNGQREDGTAFAAVVEVTSGEESTYHLGIVTVTESCTQGEETYCGGEGCPAPAAETQLGKGGPSKARRPRRVKARGTKITTASASRARSGLPECATGTGGRRAQRLEERVQEKVLRHGHTIRTDHLGAPSSTRVIFSATARISGDGDVTFRSSTVRCLGPCAKNRTLSGQSVLGVTGNLGLNGRTVDAPQDRQTCTWVISFPITSGQ